MKLYLVYWEEIGGNDHTVLMAANYLDEEDAKERIIDQMQQVDRYFDSDDIVSISVEHIEYVDYKKVILQ